MDNQKILDNAPEGATHIDGGEYLDATTTSYWSLAKSKWCGVEWCGVDELILQDDTRSLADIKRIGELEKRLIAPTDSGVIVLDKICEKFNSNKESNLYELTSSIWNKAYFEALKGQG